MGKRLDLVEELIAEEQAHRRSQRRAIFILAIAVALGLAGIGYALRELARSQPAPAAVDLSKLPPIQPGPGR